MNRILLKANAVFLIAAGGAGMIADIVGVVTGSGPQGALLGSTPQAAVGFIEAHGLAVIFGVLLALATPSPSWHLGAAAVHLLLGGANLAFWRFFAEADLLVVGYVTTVAHGVFAALQLGAAARMVRAGRVALR